MNKNISNNPNFFDRDILKKDLKTKSLRSGAITITTQGLSFLIRMGSIMVLARILTPQDFGIIQMVAAITGFAQIFLNLGLSQATIQRDEINHEQVSNLFWVNFAVGTFLTLIIASSAKAVAWFYNSPQLAGVTLALSLEFMIRGLTVQQNALLTRQMRFLLIGRIQILSQILGVVVAIYCATQGYRYWALVFNSLTSSGCSAVMFWFMTGWRPGLPKFKTGMRSFLSFGLDVSGFNIVNYFSRNLDNILIGRYHGSIALGYYSKAYQLLMMPIVNLRQPMNNVAMPVLSSLQNDPEKYRNYYTKFISILAFFSMPLVGFLFVFSDNIILLVLGEQWLEASSIFRILSFVALIQPVTSTMGLVMLTNGRSRRYFVIGTIGAVITVVSFALGVPWGASGVALSYVVSTYLRIIPFLYFSFRDTPINIKMFIYGIYRQLISTIFMSVCCYFLYNILSYKNIYLVIYFIISIFIYFFSIVILEKSFERILEYFVYVRFIFRKKI